MSLCLQNKSLRFLCPFSVDLCECLQTQSISQMLQVMCLRLIGCLSFLSHRGSEL